MTHLRQVEREDLELLLAWRYLLPDYAVQSAWPPTWAQHEEWFRYHQTELNSIIIYRGRKVGTVRADIKDGEPFISVHVAEQGLLREGIATEACSLMLGLLKEAEFEYCIAEIHEVNQASQHFFQKMGFECQSGNTAIWQRWRYSIKASGHDKLS